MATKKLYDIDAYQTSFTASVLSCRPVEGQLYELILDQTCFFPEEGGQTPDQGSINGIQVVDVQIQKDNTILHYLTGALEVGAVVEGEIEWKHRFSNMQQHSAEHIFSGLAYARYGYHNVGFHLSNQIVTMDFDGTFTPEQLQEMEWAVNEAIAANVAVRNGYPTKEELEAMEYRSKLDFTDGVRIVEIEGYDTCACCAPHVKQTGEIGMFKIQYAQSYKGGVRISFLCGFRALEEYRRKSQIISELSGILTTNQENLPEHVTKLKSQIQSLKGQLADATQKLMEGKIAEIPLEQEDVILFERDLDSIVARNVVNKLVENHDGVCGVFVGNDTKGYSYILGSKSVDCREIAAMLREKLGARGGGSPQMVQGSVDRKEEEIRKILL